MKTRLKTFLLKIWNWTQSLFGHFSTWQVTFILKSTFLQPLSLRLSSCFFLFVLSLCARTWHYLSLGQQSLKIGFLTPWKLEESGVLKFEAFNEELRRGIQPIQRPFHLFIRHRATQKSVAVRLPARRQYNSFWVPDQFLFISGIGCSCLLHSVS